MTRPPALQPTRPAARRRSRWRLAALALALAAPASACDVRREAVPPAPADGSAREPGYTRGADDAAVTVIEFSDFGCQYCRVFSLFIYPTLHREYVEPGLVRWRYVPFDIGRFPHGAAAAVAAECAAEQGDAEFWALRDAIYRGQRDWMTVRDGDAFFRALAADQGLDPDELAACQAGDDARRRLRASNRMARIGGVTGTPTFFVNGRRVVGSLPPEDFAAVLDAALGRGR
jgi:protein-disulfide isomerase